MRFWMRYNWSWTDMLYANHLGPGTQTAPPPGPSPLVRPALLGGQLGEEIGRHGMPMRMPPTRISKLELLKERRFPLRGKAERVARALAALYEKPTLQLSPAEWSQIRAEMESEELV